MTPDQRIKHLASCRAYYLRNKARARELSREWRKANPERKLALDTAWREKNREKVRASQAAYEHSNREKVSAAKRKWRLENPDAMQAARKSWEARNPDKKQVYRENRRAAEKNVGGKIPSDVIRRLMVSQAGKCVVCRCEFQRDSSSAWYLSNYELDHIMPLSLGGTNEEVNLQILCRPCNRRKAARHPEEFMRAEGLL